MKIEYRKCRKKDLIPAAYLIRTSFNHLRKSTGKEIRRYHITRLMEPEHLYKYDHDTWYCACAGKKMVGFAAALIRGKQWFLAYLFVHPSYQDKKVGKELLKRVWRNTLGMSHSLCTFAYNMQAVGIYSIFGMVPLCTLPIMEVSLDKLTILKAISLKVRTKPTTLDLAWINRLEKKIRGYSRPQEWQFWSKLNEVQIFVFEDKGRRVGYSMMYKSGAICPAGAISNVYLTKVMSETLRLFKPKKKKIRTICPTHNLELYQFLIKLGFRLIEMDIFMSDKPYADFQRYLPAQLAIF